MPVSIDPRGAIISQWLVKTQEPVSESEEEEEQKHREGMVGIYRIMIERVSVIHWE